MKYEMLSVEHESYAVNPIIARALYLVKYIEEIGSGTTDIFERCASHGLEPPIFEVDARHVRVTVKRPVFNEAGERIVEVGPNTSEVGPKTVEVGPKTAEVGPKIDFDIVLAAYRKDFRLTCEKVWRCLACDSEMSRRTMAVVLQISESSIQSATNALQEAGLLVREGQRKATRWILKGLEP